ncbi:MAG: hypothetical protein HFE33_04000 [Clostridia bacterium]|jgi:hypothetical protein|nr:hypothetical protein [Clostridia bacterium]MCI9290855.1 hypothetical protein [Clostridia bacterium]
MKAKKKILLLTSILLLAVMCFALLAGCKSSEEKQKEYYENIAKSVDKRVETLNVLSQNVFSRAWTAKFMYAYTYYGIKDEESGQITPDTVTRGSADKEGWQSGSSQFVHFMYFEVDYTNEGNYTVKTTTFEDTSRKNYYANKDKISKFNKTGELTYTVKDGVAEGQLADGIDPVFVIKLSVDGEFIKQNGIGASDNFRIYTHFMRVETRQVRDAEGNLITKSDNDALAGNGAYWSGYGEDIKYDWEKVYGMSNNRLTVLYDKGKKKINSLEIYNEDIISYYTKQDKVNTKLVLKADVVRFHEMVVKFNYKK